MLFKFSSVLYFSKYHDCKRRTEVLVLFFVFSEAMSSLKVFIFSSVYVTIDPGTSPLSLLRLVWLKFCLPFSGPCWQDFLAFSMSWAKEVFFYASPRICGSLPNKEDAPAYFEKTLLFVFGSSKGDNGFENNLKWHCRKTFLELLC